MRRHDRVTPPVPPGLTNPPFTLRLRFHGDLPFFVRPDRGAAEVWRPLREKTSVKDSIEAWGVPPPEIDLILVDGRPVDFAHQLTQSATIDVYPVAGGPEQFAGSTLQRRNIDRFVADGHLGKLTRDLRLLGIDVTYSPLVDDAELVAIASNENRALLTRDRPLLMHAAVRDGYYPRSQLADEQTREVIRRFELTSVIAPFARCLICNGLLIPSSKAEVIERLEPLTKIYYETFRCCAQCQQVYWGGSHFEKLQARVEQLLARPG
jgi:uncharacterized protein with PIN domain